MDKLLIKDPGTEVEMGMDLKGILLDDFDENPVMVQKSSLFRAREGIVSQCIDCEYQTVSADNCSLIALNSEKSLEDIGKFKFAQYTT